MKKIIYAFGETLGYLGFWYLSVFTASLPIGKNIKKVLTD